MTDAQEASIERIATAHTWGDALQHAFAQLRARPELPTPELDAQLLLAHVVGSPRARLLAYPERPLEPNLARVYAGLVIRRLAGEPVAYLVGRKEFLGLDFWTDRRALIPRPETELLVEAALADIAVRLALPGATPPVVVDVGTGTGAIAIAVAVREPRVPRVYATDISKDALDLAIQNAQHLGVAQRIEFLCGDLLDPLPERVDVLLANLPYVPPRDAPTLPRDVREYEPALALFGADDGLGHLRRLFAQAPSHLRPAAAIILEFGAGQAAEVATIACATFPGSQVRVRTDYAGWERYAIIRIS
jgi:release factor glutamine methyltransferase